MIEAVATVNSCPCSAITHLDHHHHLLECHLHSCSSILLIYYSSCCCCIYQNIGETFGYSTYFPDPSHLHSSQKLYESGRTNIIPTNIHTRLDRLNYVDSISLVLSPVSHFYIIIIIISFQVLWFWSILVILCCCHTYNIIEFSLVL